LPVNVRALVRRAFPYLVVAVVGFAIAYVIIFVFVLPSKPGSTRRQSLASDTLPVDVHAESAGILPAPNPISAPPNLVTPASPTSPAALPVDVPDLTGMALADARGVLNTLHLNTAVRYDTSSIQPPNTVLRQSPAAGAKVPDLGTVTLTASKFPPAADATTTTAVPEKGLPPIHREPDVPPPSTTPPPVPTPTPSVPVPTPPPPSSEPAPSAPPAPPADSQQQQPPSQ